MHDVENQSTGDMIANCEPSDILLELFDVGLPYSQAMAALCLAERCCERHRLTTKSHRKWSSRPGCKRVKPLRDVSNVVQDEPRAEEQGDDEPDPPDEPSSNLRQLDDGTRHVSFGVADEVHVVERLPYTSVVGDVRDGAEGTNPNYGQIGEARAKRLSSVGERHQRELLSRLLLSWRASCCEGLRARERSRSRRQREPRQPAERLDHAFVGVTLWVVMPS